VSDSFWVLRRCVRFCLGITEMNHIKNDVIGGACSIHGSRINTCFWQETPNGMEQLRGLGAF
jgi:hypothetical protein